eukprot:scaffold233907_cov36-Tisochrysis_lutea.AAC.7
MTAPALAPGTPCRRRRFLLPHTVSGRTPRNASAANCAHPPVRARMRCIRHASPFSLPHDERFAKAECAQEPSSLSCDRR